MINIKLLSALAVALAVVLPAFAQPETPSPPEAFDRAVQAIETHPLVYRYFLRDDFEQQIAAIRAPLTEESTDTQLFLAVMRAIHLVAEGHNFLAVNGGTEPRDLIYPIKTNALAGETFITDVHNLDEHLLGAVILEWRGIPWDDAKRRVLPHTRSDNIHVAIAGQLNGLLSLPRVMHELGLTEDDMSATIRVRTLDGEARNVLLKPMPHTRSGWTSIQPPSGPGAALSRTRPDEQQWCHYIKAHNTLYAMYAEVSRDAQIIASFAQEIEDQLEATGADKLVIDVRRNSGGDNHNNPPLMHAVLKNDRINRPGHLFILTSPNTFSAAMNFCGWMERETYAIFVGAPTGSPPNMAGDANSFDIGREGWTLHISQLPWTESMPWDPRQWIHPHVPAPLSIKDLMEGRDPVLEAALHFQDDELVQWLAETQLRRQWAHITQQPAADARATWPIRVE